MSSETDITKDPYTAYGTSPYTYADYLTWAYDEMVELIRGKVFKMSPAPKTNHQRVSVNLSRIISIYLHGKKCEVFHAPFDVILPIENKAREQSTTVVQPDLCVICNPELIEERGCFGAPDWIIEILSPHTSKKDLTLKYEVYEEAGVQEYWIVMPREQIVEIFRLENAKYKRIGSYVNEDSISSSVLPDLTIDLTQVFEYKNEI